MSVRQKETAEETRERIAIVAEELFRRMGFAKTAVADIAAELDMSAANVYRFFPSKNAIVETICNRCLAEMEAQISAVVRSPFPAAQRIEQVFAAIHQYHRENFLADRRVHDMVLVAIEHNWTAIAAHKERIRHYIAGLLREGITEGVFEPHDVDHVSAILLGACIRFCHPILVAQSIDEDLEEQSRETVRFLLRAVEVNRRPL
ncbi:TetR/AcrR family transcriptional regulator [Roseixanthobacter glucoisosaccharinicivorans]|uniref:TetR/AcrR family transcriptional regulator n=1 Tax=Roseixanthobacter glucoisosaccharinicivorans TaxID=3119923 RepID=UPI00372AA21B